MRTVSLEDLETRMGPASVIRPLTDALGTTDVALNHYELEPADELAYGFHAHENQEELFYVESGTITFRTLEGPVELSAGELVRFGPGEYQQGVNEGDESASVLAIGAPQSAGETEILRHCESCDGETSQRLELTDEQDAVLCVCEECDTQTGQYE